MPDYRLLIRNESDAAIAFESFRAADDHEAAEVTRRRGWAKLRVELWSGSRRVDIEQWQQARRG